MSHTEFDKRMKCYEAVSDIRLTRRTPVILRFDGCHFHTFTRGFEKPFDSILMKSMQQTMLDLCKNIQGAVFGYTQSDEITLVLVDYQTLKTSAWFDNRVIKMCSIGASMASRFFNKNFIDTVCEAYDTGVISHVEYEKYQKKFHKADFDCRAYNIPKEEVCNCIIWRQQDAERNSVQMLAQSLYSAKELHKVGVKALQDKMFTEKGVNWSNLITPKKRGTACKKNEGGKWYIDYDMPILAAEGQREYVEALI